MQQHIDSAARIVRSGGVVAYPTESVYGLGCDPFNDAALARLLQMKQRAPEKGLILIGSEVAQLRPYLAINDQQADFLQQQWPAPLTYLVPVNDRVPALVRGKHATVAVRVPDHPIARALCTQLGGPLISTSANVSGRPAARNPFQVARQLGEQVDFIVSGVCDRAARPSKIIDLATGRVIRA